MAMWRKTFQGAVEYRQALEKYERSWLAWEAKVGRDPLAEPKAPSRNLGMETLVAVMQGEILVHVHCYRADEMLQVLQLADEFGFRVRSFHHAVEAYKIRDVLAEWEVSVSTWADWWGFKMEAHDAVLQNAALISVAGGRAIIHSDSSIGIQRLNQEAAKAYWAGREAGLDISETEALRWITVNPAWALGVDDITGSLEAGKMADLVVWSGHPFSVYSRPDLVFVDGVREFDAAKPGEPWSDFEVYNLPEDEEDRR
jgi:imidazolonepropionase-like amidohydrolase